MLSLQEINEHIQDYKDTATVISTKELMYILDNPYVKEADKQIRKMNEAGVWEPPEPTKTQQIVNHVRERERIMFHTEWDSGSDVSDSSIIGHYNEDQILSAICDIIDRYIESTRRAMRMYAVAENPVPSIERLKNFREMDSTITSDIVDFGEPEPINP